MKSALVEFSRGFAPVVGHRPKLLILGSLPGTKSLEMSEYYAQPQNAFWRIMDVLFDAGPQIPYGERLGRLTARGVAVWDVLAAGRRPGSLDSSIDAATAVVNDFRSFFASHGGIRLICFNGAKAAELYRRRVLPTLAPTRPPRTGSTTSSPSTWYSI